MSKSVLKREFLSKDIKRARNLITGNYGDKTQTSSGYSKKEVERKEGDVWEEDGRQWTIKNGIKQNIRKHNVAKDILKVPLTCPKCGRAMSHRNHQKMYKIHGICFECVIDFESDLRRIGKYEEYEKAMIRGGQAAFLKDLTSFVKDSLNTKHEYVTEAGDIENWVGDTSKFKQGILNKLEEYTKHMNKIMK